MADKANLDDELKSRLAHYLDSLEGAVKAGGDAVATQGPEVARELVAYTMATSLLQAAAAACLIASGVWCVRRVWSRWEAIKEWSGEGDGTLPALMTVFSAAAVPAGVVWLFTSVGRAAKCYFAPKLFVLEYVMGLIRGDG